MRARSRGKNQERGEIKKDAFPQRGEVTFLVLTRRNRGSASFVPKGRVLLYIREGGILHGREFLSVKNQ